MSHFTVLVIGPNPEKQLEPYDESIEVDKYQRKLVSEEDKKSFLETYTTPSTDRDYAEMSEEDAEANKLLSFDELYEKYGEDWNGHEWEKNEAGEWAEFSTYNPKSKWDWFQLGGRWTGFFKVKEGADGEVGDFSLVSARRAKEGWADQLLKRDIDFEGMRKVAEDEARERYNEVLAIFEGVIPKVEHSWKSIIDENNPLFNTLDIDEKRKFFHAQPALLKVKEVQKNKENQEKLGWFFDVEEFQCTVEEYIQRARNSAISSFALVKDGVWYEKGEMGWWAHVSNEKNNWDEEFTKLLDEVSDDTMLSLYDCHI